MKETVFLNVQRTRQSLKKKSNQGKRRIIIKGTSESFIRPFLLGLQDELFGYLQTDEMYQQSSKENEYCFCLLTDHERLLAIFGAWRFR